VSKEVREDFIMAILSAKSLCPWCGKDVKENEIAVFISLVETTSDPGSQRKYLKPDNYTWEKGKLRIKGIGGTSPSPKNLLHAQCWNEFLDFVEINVMTQELGVKND
jgi:hypothetical protein